MICALVGLLVGALACPGFRGVARILAPHVRNQFRHQMDMFAGRADGRCVVWTSWFRSWWYRLRIYGFQPACFNHRLCQLMKSWTFRTVAFLRRLLSGVRAGEVIDTATQIARLL